MPATKENILTQIDALKRTIEEGRSSGVDTTDMVREIDDLYYKFSKANDALNEGKGILKG